jgi:hypothetical protein
MKHDHVGEAQLADQVVAQIAAANPDIVDVAVAEMGDGITFLVHAVRP